MMTFSRKVLLVSARPVRGRLPLAEAFPSFTQVNPPLVLRFLRGVMGDVQFLPHVVEGLRLPFVLEQDHVADVDVFDGGEQGDEGVCVQPLIRFQQVDDCRRFVCCPAGGFGRIGGQVRCGDGGRVVGRVPVGGAVDAADEVVNRHTDHDRQPANGDARRHDLAHQRAVEPL